jgi:protease IV
MAAEANHMAAKQKEGMGTGMKILITVVIIFSLAMVASIVAAIIMLFGNEDVAFGANVAVIPIEGVIMASGESNAFQGVVTSDTIIDDIERAEEDPSIKAVLFRINSPGGSAVGSDEIAAAIRSMEKPSVALIREVGASGAYWAASAADHVVANRMSITGSIGVIGSYLSFGQFLKDWNVTYNQLISGDRKDVGTPYRELAQQERLYLQEKLDAIHTIFTDSVAENRNMSAERVAALADGGFFLGFEAKERGLVDALGGEREALDWINATIKKEPVTVECTHEPTLLDLLSQLSAQGRSPETMLQALSQQQAPLAR